MCELRQGLGFTLEAFECALEDIWKDIFGSNHLNSYIGFEARVVGLVDNRHTALAKLLEDMITSEGLTN